MVSVKKQPLSTGVQVKKDTRTLLEQVLQSKEDTALVKGYLLEAKKLSSTPRIKRIFSFLTTAF